MIKASIRSLLGYLAACAAAGFFLAGMIVVPPLLEQPSWGGLHALAVFTVLNSIFVAVAAFVPALAVIIFANRMNCHSGLFYALAGACVGFLSYVIWFWLLPLVQSQPMPRPLVASELLVAFGGAVLLFGGGGLLGGIIYWLVAVRVPAGRAG